MREYKYVTVESFAVQDLINQHTKQGWLIHTITSLVTGYMGDPKVMILFEREEK